MNAQKNLPKLGRFFFVLPVCRSLTRPSPEIVLASVPFQGTPPPGPSLKRCAVNSGFLPDCIRQTIRWSYVGVSPEDL
jgi:hypothetical protein